MPNYVDVTLDLPGCWNDCDRTELEAIARQLLTGHDSKELFQTVILLFLIRHRAQLAGITLSTEFFERINWEDLVLQQGEALGWIHAESTLTNNPYPAFAHGFLPWQKLQGPADDFNDLTVGEFEDCEVFSIRFSKEKDTGHLAMIAAILYRPSLKKKRQLYNPDNAESRKAFFAKLPFHQLFLVYTWYCSCRTRLPKYFPHVFDGSGKGAPDITAFTKCIHAGAGPRNGTRTDIRKTPLKEYLLDLDLQAKAAKEMEAELKKQKR